MCHSHRMQERPEPLVAEPLDVRVADAEPEQAVEAARDVVEDAVRSGRVVYGVTTGFGNLVSVSIAPDDAAQLQLNLLRSHAVGSGPPLPEPTVRAMVALLAGSLRRGRSGVRLGV